MSAEISNIKSNCLCCAKGLVNAKPMIASKPVSKIIVEVNTVYAQILACMSLVW